MADIQESGGNTYDALRLAELTRQYPKLSREFIKANLDKLTERLEARDRRGTAPAGKLEETAQSIPDRVEDMFRGIETPISQETTLVRRPERETPEVEEGRAAVVRLLTYYLERARKGEFENVCVIATLRDDTNMECLFTTPANLYSYLGFLHHVINLTTNTKLGSRDNLEEE